MEDDQRRKKIEAGREKLAEFRKRKNKEKDKMDNEQQDNSLTFSDTSVSLSPLPLSDKEATKQTVQVPDNTNSESSSISENIEISNSNSNSENDRSLQEIFIGNIPGIDSPDNSNQTSVLQQLNELKSLQSSLLSDSSIISLNALEKFELENNNFLDVNQSQNILDEIIKQDQFDNKSDSIKSNPFDDLSSITLRSERITGCENKTSQNDLNVSKNKAREVVMANKEQIVAQVSTEIDSLKEVNSSNPSTLSTTEYKQYYDKLNLGAIEFQDLLSHRDDHIKQLTEALQQVLQDRNHLQEQADFFAQEIADLREELVQTTAILKKNNWNVGTSSNNQVEKKSQNKQQIEDTDSSTSLKSLKISPKNLTEINFDFEDPEFNESMTQEEKKIVAEMRNKINMYVQQKVDECKLIFEMQVKDLKDQLEYEKNLHKKQSSSNKNTEDSISSLPEHSIFSPKQAENQECDSKAFNDTFTQEEQSIIADLRTKIFNFIQQRIQSYSNSHEIEIKILKDRLESEKAIHDTEIDRLRQLLNNVKTGSVDINDLRQELNQKHNTEMEELRTYFEKRCADIEKHYSEEIFSQQSRKMSGSSVSELESEIFPAQLGPGGDSSLPVVSDVTKTDFSSLRIELQNKYHAELEILREDYENRLDELKINHETYIQEIEQKYDTIINALKTDLEEAQKTAVATQEVASSGDFEIAEVVESYERRLQEQVMLAKIDIISSLEQQIQTLVSSPSDNLHWPPELLQLRDRLTQHWNKEIQDLKIEHSEEIVRLKEEHEKNLTRILEREKRNSLCLDETEARKERDSLKKVASNLRQLVAELLKYFTKCEDELNNTLVEELLKYGFDKELSVDLNESSPSGSENLELISPRVKRVHFTPDVTGIIDIINETSLNLDVSNDISREFRTELDLCLSRLKSEANAILTLSSNLKSKSDLATSDFLSSVKLPLQSDDKITSLTRQLITETQLKNELNIQLDEMKSYVQNLEAEKQSIENQLEQIMDKHQALIMELNNAKEKIHDLVESGRKEIISEGYGENQITGSTTLGGRIASLSELQERARHLLAETEVSTHPMFQLVEELCRESDKIMEDAKKDHEDLVQQIEAADKKLRATTKFLEEQAVDREQERDEAQREIAALKEQIRDGEKSKGHCQRIHKEEQEQNSLNDGYQVNSTVLETIEHLEGQMREMTLLMNECESRKVEVEKELKDAIDKIWVLRDIIRDLEAQIEEKSKAEVDFKNLITQLEDKFNFESKQNEELVQHISSLKSLAEDNQFEVIRKLEAENQKLRVSSELIGPDGVLKQFKTQLNEIEKTIEKRTKDLETLHIVISSTNCSTPSEDMSIRDQIRPPSSNDENSDLPLEQLARLKDKLIRHARAEDAAMKRIRDLEMQVFNSKHDFEEIQSERDILQDQLSEQNVLISSLQLRLDEQRLRVESVQKQSNTSLEHRIYELENDVQEQREIIHMRDNNIKDLNLVIEQSRKRITDLENQLTTTTDLKKEIITQFKTEIDKLKAENKELKEKLETEISKDSLNNINQTSEVFDTLINEKNASIDRLKNQVQELEHELNFYSTLNISKEQLIYLSNTFKTTDVTSMVNITEPDQVRRQEISYDSIKSGEDLAIKSNLNDTAAFIMSTFRDSKFIEKESHNPFVTSELSTIEKELPSGDAPKVIKHVHFPDSLDVTELNSRLVELKQEVEVKNNILKTYETDLQNLRENLETSNESLKTKVEYYIEEIEQLKSEEKNIRVELAEAKMELHKNSQKLEELEKDSARKDEMYMNLAKEKRELENQIKELQTRNDEFQKVEELIKAKNKEIYSLEQQLTTVTSAASAEHLKEQIFEKEDNIKHLNNKISYLETRLEERAKQLETVQHDLNNKTELLQIKEKDYNNIITQCDGLTKHVENLKELLEDRCKKIEQMECDLKREQELRSKVCVQEKHIEELQTKLNTQGNSLRHEGELDIYKKELAEKNAELQQTSLIINKLSEEVQHLQKYLQEKDKIIDQITADSNSLHVSLEAIQSKIQESGNLIDLKKRLKEEQALTSALHEELKYLKQSIEHYETEESTNAMETLMLLKESIEREKVANEELKITKDSLQQEVHKLKEKLALEEQVTNKFKQLLEDEKMNSSMIQMQDANIIESMRVRLEALLDQENEYETLLQKEKKTREELENQLISLNIKSPGFALESNEQDITCLKMNNMQLSTENEVLKSDIETLRNINSLVKTELLQSRELNDSLKQEINNLKLLVASLTNIDHSINKKNRNEGAFLAEEYQKEKKQMMKEISELQNMLRNVQDREKELNQKLFLEKNKQMKGQIPEQFADKIAELSKLVQSSIADNKDLNASLERVTDEKRVLMERLKDLEERLQIQSPFDDPVARADHLFARYLKSESYRKALIFQKRYLLTLLASYQKFSTVNIAELNFVFPKVPHSKGQQRFRSVVYVLISIHRMQYIVQRWNKGRRLGASALSKRPVTAFASVARPVSSLGLRNEHNKPWTGLSPPSKDKNIKRTAEPLGDIIQESLNLAPLQAPALLSEYIERFDNIQQKLGLAIQKTTT